MNQRVEHNSMSSPANSREAANAETLTPGSLTPGSLTPGMYNVNLTDLPVDFASLLRALWRRKWFVAGVWIIFILVAVYSVVTSIPVYKSKAALELKALPALPKSELHSETSMSKVTEKKYMESMKRLLESRKLALVVIKKMELYKSGETGTTEISEQELIKVYAGKFQSNLFVNIEKGGVTGVITLAYQDTSALKSADILTTLIEQFWLIMYERPEILFSKERIHIKQMINDSQKKLDQAYETLNTFLSKNDIFFLENIDVMTKKDIEITSSQLLDLSKKAEQATHERIQAEVVFNQSIISPEGIKEFTQSQLVIELKKELAKAQVARADLMAVYAKGHTRLKAETAKISSIKQAIAKEKKNIIQTIAHNYEIALSKEKDLLNRVEEMKTYVIRKKALKGEYDAIEAEIEINRKVYQSVLQQYEALKIETVFPFTLSMIDPPLVPTRPVKPNKMMRLFIGMVLGAVFGSSLALLIEFTNPGLRAPVEAERRTGLPLLGAIPPLKSKKELKSMGFHEGLRHLSSWPEFNHSFSNPVGILLSTPGMSISITSPEADEGTMLTGLGISLQLIRAGKKVLLIDADFSKSWLDKAFDLSNAPGLLDILENQVKNNAIKDGSDHGLAKLPVISESAAGGKLFALKTGIGKRGADTPLGLIETPAFIDLLSQYQKEADYVVIITPPLLREVATYIINRATNITMLVLKERQSKIKDAVRATEIMNRIGISILGLIVTESDHYNT